MALSNTREALMRKLHSTRALPCPRCVGLAWSNTITSEMVQPLPETPDAPLSVDDDSPCCFDCGAADVVVRLLNQDGDGRRGFLTRAVFAAKRMGQPVPEHLRDPSTRLNFEMARVAVGNDRSEQYRLPGYPLGLVIEGWVRPSYTGELEEHYRWLEAVHLVTRLDEDEDDDEEDDD